MTTTIFDPTLTAAGQAAAFNADNDGIELKLTHVSFGTAHYDPTGAETALVNEVSGKITIAGGSRPTLTQIRMTSVWRADAGTYPIGEVAFWSNATLVFVWSRADESVVGYKTPGVDFVLFNDLGFTQVPAGSINITVDPDASVALAALAAHEGADNAHPQYVRYDVFPAAQKNLWSKTVAGTANNIVITMQDGVHVDAYEDGLMIRFKATAQSTGAATVNIDGKGVVDIRKGGGDPLEPGDIREGGIYELVFDTDHFELAGGVGGSGFLQKFPHVAVAGQTEFSANYSPGSVLVFKNGREVGDAAYVATDGLSITLNDPATLGDEVLVVAFTAFSVADAFTHSEGDIRFARLAFKNVFTKANVAAEQALPATSGSVVLDLALANNFGGQLTGNIVLANPANMVSGQSGVLHITNDGSTARTIAYGSFWKASGGVLPPLTASAGAVDIFGYYVESTSRITIVQQADSK